MHNKKSQIAQTLTWFVAFIIIFFIIILFLSAVIISSERKQVSNGKDEILLQSSLNDIDSQRVLISLLNSIIVLDGKGVSVKNAVLLFPSADDTKKSEIKEKIRENIGKLNSDVCYAFSVDYSGIDEAYLKQVSGMRGSQYLSEFIEKNSIKLTSIDGSGIGEADARVQQYKEVSKQKMLEKASSIILLSDGETNQIIKIKLYSGACL